VTYANNGVCSLREAVIAANTNTASGGMAGECAADQAAPTVDVINIPAGTYTLTTAPINNTLVNTTPDTEYTFGEYTLTWNGVDAFDATVTPDATNGDLDITESVNLVGADKPRPPCRMARAVVNDPGGSERRFYRGKVTVCFTRYRAVVQLLCRCRAVVKGAVSRSHWPMAFDRSACASAAAASRSASLPEPQSAHRGEAAGP
jgi:hypothetical protein